MRPRSPAFTALALLVLLVGSALPTSAQPGGQRAEISKAVVNVSGLKPGEKAMAAVVLDIFPGFHAQSRTPTQAYYIKFDAKLDPNPAVTFGEVVYPPGHVEEYPALGKLNVYVGRIVVKVPVQVKPDAPPGPVKITGTLRYQICDDQVCFPPESSKFAIETKVVGKDEKVEAVEAELFEEEAPHEGGDAARGPTAAATTAPAAAGGSGGTPAGGFSSAGLEGSNWSFGYALGAAFIAGLLFNIMPCVLPVLPLKASGFYEAAGHSRARSFFLGLMFSLGLITVFGVLALFILVFKSFTWGSLFSKGWFIWSIVALLVVMAFGLFDAFTFRLPLGAYTFEPRHDTVSGNFLLGMLTAILATPCTAPLLPPLLLWASSQPSWLGVPAFLMVGVGMASPYLILSATPELARKFPRTGPWSELFKQMMGFMMLAAAAYFAGGRLVQGTGFWWIVVAMVAVAALFLVARTVQLSKNAAPVAVSSVLAIVMLGGVLWWTAQITGLGSPAYAAGGDAKAQWVPYSTEKFEEYRKQGKPVLVKFTANWCATCQVVEGTVFKNPAVWDSLAKHDVVAMKVDLTEEGAPGNDLLLQLNPGGGIPLTAVFGPKLQQPILLSSIYKSDALLSAIDKATEGAQVASK
jgi:thiol:disulfide interchange protein DsbD